MNSESERATRELEHEVDITAARIIRQEGLPLWEALRKAEKEIQTVRKYRNVNSIKKTL